ncbi:MAG: phosphopantothenoylcysteine decarboxylase / phosphopantothenate---cysteine ligase [Solirubrobacteraceae bacterium]|nr:phosphopantothenoylcysteine decarboxylase / phosphopantothenate---cysteine ligase [Solirubrobacteraceae bacterium]
MARLLLGVSGGIAAYKALELVRLAVKAGHAVRVIQTPTSQRFVGAASFAALTGAPVLVSEFERDPARGAFSDQAPPEHDPPSHLELVANADVFLIAPASANTIAKLAHGLADNLLTSAALATRGPVAVAPAMNDAMYEHPATRASLELLRERGVTVIEPDTGALGAKGEWGVGRLREPPELLTAFEALVPPRAGDERGRWSGLRVLVTAGGTREPIDHVRYIGNRSSGRMGFALADEAARRGAEVTVVAANVGLPRNPVISYVDVESVAELLQEADELFPRCDVLLMAAAVSDFQPTEVLEGKVKKNDKDWIRMDLQPTTDVLAGLAARRQPRQTLVGFAAEHGPGLEEARRKLEHKGLDVVVLNDISRRDIGFDSTDNEVTIVTATGETAIARSSKADVATAVLDEVDRLRADAVHRA